MVLLREAAKPIHYPGNLMVFILPSLHGEEDWLEAKEDSGQPLNLLVGEIEQRRTEPRILCLILDFRNRCTVLDESRLPDIGECDAPEHPELIRREYVHLLRKVCHSLLVLNKRKSL